MVKITTRIMHLNDPRVRKDEATGRWVALGVSGSFPTKLEALEARYDLDAIGARRA